MDKKELYNSFYEKLSDALVRQASDKGLLDGQLIIVEELQEKWHEIAPEYMADAVSEYNKYPTVAIAWAAYLGMGMAALWDTSWDKFKNREDIYKFFVSARGFDEMDEFVVEEMLSLKLDSPEATSIENAFRSFANTTIAMMRGEGIESQSADAFYLFSNATMLFFNIGVAIELKQLGYKYEKVIVDIPNTEIN